MKAPHALLWVCCASLASAETVTLPGLGSLVGGSILAGGTVPVSTFLGIPYAKAPVADLRWRAPEDPLPWGVRDASAFNMSCPGSYCAEDPRSEDCLFLNVFKPEGVNASGLPVMFFVHGGSFNSGCSNHFAMYQQVAASVKRGSPVVGVTINYRLNFFGFLGSDELRSSPSEPTGTYGLLDQRKALQFVNRYISLFGGDPGKVTLFGQSAGAMSVTAHMVMPDSYNRSYDNGRLFSSVGAESGLGANWGVRDLDTAEAQFRHVKTLLNCSDVACVRSRDILAFEAILPLFPSAGIGSTSLTFAPVMDGVELTTYPRFLIERGEHAKVPVLAGSNRDEFSMFLLGSTPFPNNSTALEFDLAMLPFLPLEEVVTFTARLQAAYSPEHYAYPANLQGRSVWWWMTMRALSDMMFTCPTRHASAYLSRSQDVYSYFLNHPTISPTYLVGSGPDAFVAPHESEIPYVFNCTQHYVNCDFSVGLETDLASQIVTYWVQYGAEGWLPTPWTKHSADIKDDQTLFLELDALRLVSNFRAEQCDLWDEIFTAKHGPSSQRV
eukprot:TRINITY_DN3904_c3_g1_i1.p1 TRINITY_DN3904_c3_g1~~TRINITY_DN3904_c3_g1_i1.p1  ORF type:complete len:584 (+),score=218.96 TRINITY_DN3904_c3_g1_i1:94-1752(+)